MRAETFWAWHFDGDGTFDEEERYELTLRHGDHGLRVDVHEGTSTTLFDLETGAQLGWLDDAHFHPSALRVVELLRLTEREPLGRLLLLPFTVATTEDDAEPLERAISAAWDTLGFTTGSPGIAPADFVDQQVSWFQDTRGRWCLRQPFEELSLRPLYTLRTSENAEFPAWLSGLT